MQTEAQLKQPTAEDQRGNWRRRYPPLITLVIAILIAVVVMPSALNLPQSNPSTVLEYAPIAPEDENPPPDGSLSDLGLGVSGGAGGGAIDSPPPQRVPQSPPRTGRALKPQTKRCVGNPPRQTEDVMAPPCVPYFEGDNGGETWTGVTKDEIKVLVYMDAGSYSDEVSPVNGTYCDLEAPPGKTCPGLTFDHVWVRWTRALARFFNDRFQTYNRRVHYYMYWTDANTEQLRRADAADNFAVIKPFAVLDQATFNGFNQAYLDALARREVTAFASEFGFVGDFLRDHAPQLWSFWPDTEHVSELYASYVCQKVAPFPNATHAGPPYTNTPRKFGLMYTVDPGKPQLKVARNIIKARLEACGVYKPGETPEVTFPRAGWRIYNQGDQTYGARNVAELQSKDVTTVLWLGGKETKTTEAAAAQGYFPEWVVLGDGDTDAIAMGRYQNPEVWSHAWVVSPLIRQDEFETSIGYQAYREAEPNGRRDPDGRWASIYYRHHFMLFQAIQVAGPNLSPPSIDAGFHAIPRIKSNNPYLAAFYFDPDDYSGVKDAMEMWWDTESTPPEGTQPGCYKMVRGGKRFGAWNWEGGDDVFSNQSDACNGFGGSSRDNLNPG